MRIGFLGAGRISEVVAPAVIQANRVECEAVAARDLSRAKAFAEKWGFKKAYGSYEEMMKDPDVDVVYIATPHSFHYEQMMMALEHGKGVFCEKAFCANSIQAKAVRDYAREKGLFAAEAIWTRYMPSRKIIKELIDSGIIGTPRVLTGNLCYSIAHKERMIKPELAGGALLDLGVYGLNFAFMCFGNEIERIESSAFMHPTGVDGMESITIFFKNQKMAVITAGMYSRSDRKGIIHGDKGYLVVENINNPSSVSVFDTSDKLIQTIQFPDKVNGYEYEFEEAAAAFDAGKTQTDFMPLDETVFVMEICDRVRKRWGQVC
ncbi:MAG: Gfo/Idh/MocA family oxidoreductase [Lachnospiraceae bacterium]|nr:Gfo/Idh/MocA family oxidoreductase [Lachnospiraceae bacterium]